MDKNYFTRRRNYQKYPESIKKAVVQEYESSDCSQAYLSRKYGIVAGPLFCIGLRSM